MTEAQWHSCKDPTPMLEFLGTAGRLTERKARLFAAACCRRIWPLLADERSREAVKVAEEYADGLTTQAEHDAARTAALQAAKDAAQAYAEGLSHSCGTAAAEAAADAALTAVGDRWLCQGAYDDAMTAANLGDLHHADRDARDIEFAAQAALLREILGPLSYRPVTFDPSFLTDAVLTLAQSVYDNRLLPEGHFDLARLDTLAAALAAAGCDDAELLGHLRSPGPHVRGCHALDTVLGRS